MTFDVIPVLYQVIFGLKIIFFFQSIPHLKFGGLGYHLQLYPFGYLGLTKAVTVPFRHIYTFV